MRKPRTSRGRVSLVSQLIAHVEVCDERYENIEVRLGRMEKIMLSVAGTSMLMLITALGYFLTRHLP